MSDPQDVFVRRMLVCLPYVAVSPAAYALGCQLSALRRLER